MRNVKYAGIQMQCSRSVEENIAKADKMVREAAANGAQIILLPELLKDSISVRREIMIITHLQHLLMRIRL